MFDGLHSNTISVYSKIKLTASFCQPYWNNQEKKIGFPLVNQSSGADNRYMLDGLASSRIVAISQACLFHLKPSGRSLWIFIISKDSDKQPYLDKTWLLQLCTLISLNAPCNWNKDCVLNFVRWHYHTCSTTPASCMWAYLVQAGSLHVQSMCRSFAILFVFQGYTL